MNWGAAQAFVLQIARIGVGGAGVYLLVTGGNQTIGWGLLAASGLTAAIDVAKVAAQVKNSAAQATAAAQTTATITVTKPAPADDPPPKTGA